MAARQSGSHPVLRYRLGMRAPHTHLFQVELAFPEWPGESVDLALPAWTPGAYKIVDNARNLRGFMAEWTGGEAVTVDRLDFHTWRVHHAGRPFTVRYQVFADKMTIHQAQLNAQHAFVNGCMVFVYPKGGQHAPCELKVDAPAGWAIATGLEELGGDRFGAPSYDALIDCPIEIGHFETERFTAAGVPCHIAWRSPDLMDRARLVDGLTRIVEVESRFWGCVPFDSYTFIYNTTTDGFLNGLEHANSTAIQGNIDLAGHARGLFALTAHEVFHAWNVKRLRPIGLGPFDYQKPAHTTALWIVEGLTEYYTERMCLQAGISTKEDYLKGICDNLVSLERSPGRQFTTLEEASFITWNFGDDRWNGAINYYLKGSLVGVALDLTIRHRTDNTRSLDDFMRRLWERYGAVDLPYDPEEVEPIAEEVAGSSLQEFFQHHLRSTADTDWAEVFALAGLELVTVTETAALQARTSFKEGGLLVEDVRAGGALQQAGLQAGDLIVALGGEKASDGLVTRLGRMARPGDRVPLEFFRDDRLFEVLVTLGSDKAYALVPMPDAPDLACRIREDWLAASSTVLALA